MATAPSDTAVSSEPMFHEPAPDAAISQADALAYWASTPATVNGMLGGFEHVSRIDLQGSKNFIAKLRRKRAQQRAKPVSTSDSTGKQLLGRTADCGAGIGRITLGLLSSVASIVDIVEPVVKFTDEITQGQGFASLRKEGKIGKVYNAALQDWHPSAKSYDLIWNQWCLGQLTDLQLVAYLGRCARGVSSNGWIVVKENLSTHSKGADLFDDVDSSVTRSEANLRRLFQEAGLEVVAQEVQRGLPKVLYPVMTFALQPRVC